MKKQKKIASTESEAENPDAHPSLLPPDRDPSWP